MVCAGLPLSVLMTTVPAEAKKKQEPVPVTGHQIPFECNQSWTGSTRSAHSPSKLSIDFNAPGDLGKPVVASAAGRVVTANNTSNKGYGRHVVLDHGNGETSVYAHLKKVTVTVGTWLDQGALLGTLGSTGNSSGPHLHFEQKVGKSVVPAWFGGARYRYGTSRSANCADMPIAGNLLPGPEAEVAVFRRVSGPSFHVLSAVDGTTRTMRVGRAYDEPVVGDWDGDGTSEVGAYATSGRVFTVAGEAGFVKIKFGARGDRPVAGDWDGDGAWEVGIYRPSHGLFKLRSATGTKTTVRMGRTGGVPLTGDWDGDGLTDLGLYDPTTATFLLRTRAEVPVVTTVQYGFPGDLPAVGDWDGDGVTDLGTWSPRTATFNQQVAEMPDAVSAPRSIRFGTPRR